MPIAVGDVAPEFELILNIGEAPVRLSDYRGEKSVLLLFFPLAFSEVCTEEMCLIAEDYDAWQALGAEVIGASIDSPYVTKKFADACKATYPILSDFNKEAAESYGVLIDDFAGLKGVTARAAFLVDLEGRIAYAEITENPGVLPDFDAIKQVLAGG